LCVLPQKRLAKAVLAFLGLQFNMGALRENPLSQAGLLGVAGVASGQKQPKLLNRVCRKAKGRALNLRKPL